MDRVRNLNPPMMYLSSFRKIPLFLDAIRFSESIFALPFAYMGMVLASGGFPTWSQFAWITVAMMSARTAGMSLNRVIDRHIDARNPRTSDRHLPKGVLKASDLNTLSIFALATLFFAAAQLNLLVFVLAPMAVVYLFLYPFTKRFTWSSSLFLGGALAIAPLGAWIGVNGALSWEPLLLSLAVALWAGSFDILYHIQDRNFYLEYGLYSIPQRFGVLVAFRCSRVLDGLAMVCLVSLGISLGLAYPYYLGCAAAVSVLGYKYIVVSPPDLSRLNVAFFRINAYVSTLVFIGALAAVLME